MIKHGSLLWKLCHYLIIILVKLAKFLVQIVTFLLQSANQILNISIYGAIVWKFMFRVRYWLVCSFNLLFAH